MREDVLNVICVVALGGEPGDTLLEQMDFQRPHLRDEHIYAHVPLRPPDQQRVVNVLLYDALLVILQVLQVVNNRDLSTSTEVCGLTDPHLLFLVCADGLPRE